MLTVAALALGMAVVTAALSVALDVGDRLAAEFTSLGANLVVTPQADSLPLEIGGVDYRPANSGAYLPESDLPKIKSVFWHNNIIAFAPELQFLAHTGKWDNSKRELLVDSFETPLIGTWVNHSVPLSDARAFISGIDKTNSWWRVKGRWFIEGERECVVGAKAAQRLHLQIGDQISVNFPDPSKMVQMYVSLRVTGILSTGGDEDGALLTSLSQAQAIGRQPGLYRKLYVLALTKPEDAFGRRD